MDLTFAEQVKIVLSRKNMTIKQLAGKIQAKTGQKMSRQNLTQRLGRDNFQEQDMRMIAEILECPFKLSILEEEDMQTVQAAGALAAEAFVPDTDLEAEGENDVTVGDMLDILESMSDIDGQEAGLEEDGGEKEETPDADRSQETEKDAKPERAEEQKAGQEQKPEEEAQAARSEETKAEKDSSVKDAEPEGNGGLGEKAGQKEGREEETSRKEAGQEEAVQKETEQKKAESQEDTKTGTEENGEGEKNDGQKTDQKETEAKDGENAKREEPGKKEETKKPQIIKAKKRVEKWEPKPLLRKVDRSGIWNRREEALRKKKANHPHGEWIGATPQSFSKDFMGAPAAKGEINPYTGQEYETNSVRTHPKRIGYLQVYDRGNHKWTDMTEWAFLGFQEQKKALLGRDYDEPIYLE